MAAKLVSNVPLGKAKAKLDKNCVKTAKPVHMPRFNLLQCVSPVKRETMPTQPGWLVASCVKLAGVSHCRVNLFAACVMPVDLQKMRAKSFATIARLAGTLLCRDLSIAKTALLEEPPKAQAQSFALAARLAGTQILPALQDAACAKLGLSPTSRACRGVHNACRGVLSPPPVPLVVKLALWVDSNLVQENNFAFLVFLGSTELLMHLPFVNVALPARLNHLVAS